MNRRWDGERFDADPDFGGIVCPHCGQSKATVQSLFGSTASEILLFCESCRTCFNWIKWRQQLPPLAGETEG